MMTWFCLNAGLTALTWLFLTVAQDSPHRLRFRITMAALTAWLVPWQMLAGWLPVMGEIGVYSSVIRETSVGLVTTGARGATGDGIELSVLLVFLAALPGLCLLLTDAWHYRRLLHRLTASSYQAGHLWQNLDDNSLATVIPARRDHYPAIRIQTIKPGAFTTGVLTPVIWLHEDLVNDPNLPTVLLHEYGHIRQHDNAWLWLINLQEKFFWWNPLVFLLGKRSRQLMELSCDEFCASVQDDYRLRLNALILACSSDHVVVFRERLMTTMFQQRNFNVERVRLLERSYTMKLKHIISAGLLAAGSFLMISVGTAQSPDLPEILPEDPEARARYLEIMEQRARGEEVELSQQAIIDGLEVYRQNLEAQYDELRSEHEALREAYEELQQQTN